MTRRILWISAIGPHRSKDDARAYIESKTRPDTELEYVTLDRGPSHLEYYYYESLVLPDLLHEVKRGENEGYDATVLGCFYDLGLEEARELSDAMPVTAPAESTTHLAATMGDTFSIIVGRRKWVPQMRDRVRAYGLDDRLASFEPVGCGVLDFQVDPAETHERLLEAGRRAVEDEGAEVLILGCASEYGFYEDLQDALGVPVLDPTVVPLKTAELKIDLAEYGWVHSNVGGYESPPIDEIREWNLDDDYRTNGVWSDEARADSATPPREE